MFLPFSAPQAVGFNPQKLARATSLVKGWVEAGLVPYAETLLVRKGEVVLEEGFSSPGWPGIAAGQQGLYPAASLSKLFTATLYMQFVEEGLVGLNRPVQEYLPEFQGENKDLVMVHHLLTHSSGIRETDVRAYAKAHPVRAEVQPGQDPTIAQRLAECYAAPLWKLPGEEMSYCGLGFEMAAEILRRATGRPLHELAKERLFDPLGMRDTAFIVPQSSWSRAVQFPQGFCAGWFGTPNSLLFSSAAGGAYTTLRDLAIFGQLFLNKGEYNGTRLLCPASVAAMTRNQIPGVRSTWGKIVFPEAFWGLGWMLAGDKKDESGTLRSYRTFYHTGAGCSLLLVDPDRELVLVSFLLSLVRLPNDQPLRRFDFLADTIFSALEE